MLCEYVFKSDGAELGFDCHARVDHYSILLAAQLEPGQGWQFNTEYTTHVLAIYAALLTGPRMYS